MYYRVPLAGSGHELVAQLTTFIASDDPVSQVDQRRLAKVLAERANSTTPASPANVDAALAQLDALLMEELGREPLGDVLDIATGSGRILRSLAPHAKHAVGIDISTEALRFARKQTYSVSNSKLSRCVFRRGDMYKLPVDTASFDTATLERVLVAAARVEDVLKEAARALATEWPVCGWKTSTCCGHGRKPVGDDASLVRGGGTHVRTSASRRYAWRSSNCGDCAQARCTGAGNAFASSVILLRCWLRK